MFHARWLTSAQQYLRNSPAGCCDAVTQLSLLLKRISAGLSGSECACLEIEAEFRRVLGQQMEIGGMLSSITLQIPTLPLLH